MSAIMGGGVVVDCGGLAKPLVAQAVVKRAKEYIETMNLLRKPCARVVLSRTDYDRVFEAMKKSRADGAPEICGLSLHGVPVERMP